ncbi:MAG: hypothetical protein WCI03_01185 [bacterium]
MPKKILFESAIHQLAAAGRRRLETLGAYQADITTLRKFLQSLRFEVEGARTLKANWSFPASGSATVDFTDAKLYQRGDACLAAQQKCEGGHNFSGDAVERHNRKCFDRCFDELVAAAAITLHK